MNDTTWRTAALAAIVALAVAGALAVGPMSALSQDNGAPTPGADGDINCGEFDNREQVGEVFDPDNDEYGLDGDDNDIACEGVGDNPTPEEPGGATATDTATETTTETTTETETETPTATETETEETTEETDTPEATETTEEAAETEQAEQAAESNDTDAANDTAYYQIDFVVGEPIENLDWPNGTYTNDQLIRFAHGSSDEPITRRSDGEFTTDEEIAERIDSQNITVENGTATTTFTVADGESVTLTLASYTKPDPTWDPEDEDDQVFVDSETRTFESGTHTLTVDLPDEDPDE